MPVVATEALFSDPRLAGLYDTLCADRADVDFYLALAAELDAITVVDIGCGTGVLATELAARGHRVVGVDPSPAMLAIARTRPDHPAVTWIDGDATALPVVAADLAVMTGHVAQVFLDDVGWSRTLHAVRRALAPGGRLAFESRNPAALAWQRWNPAGSRRHLQSVVLGRVETWHEVTDVHGDLVTFDQHHLLATGEDLVSTSTLRFPTPDRLTASLAAAGFAVEAGYGDWDRSPITTTSPELIFVARNG